MGKIRIELLGTDFKVNAPEDDEYLEKLFSYYKQIAESVEHSSKLTDPLKISILSGLAIVDELYKEKQKSKQLEKRLTLAHAKEEEELTSDMIHSLTKILDSQESLGEIHE